MTLPLRSLRSRVTRAIVLAVALCTALSTAPATAEPDIVRTGAAASRPAHSIPGAVGSSTASLEATTFAIPVDGAYSFTGRVATTSDTGSVQMRLRVFNPSGRLMTQRTRIFNDPGAGEVTASFERETSDLNLSPGAYPVELEVRLAIGGTVSQSVIDSDLLVYDPDAPRQPVAFTARITGQPLSGPQGAFVQDPGQLTRARDDAGEIARWVLGRPDAMVTVAISPILLEEWRRISEGYEFSGSQGLVSVPASSSVPVAYSETLGLLRQAAGTGRLELVSLGYTDPDLSELSARDRVADIAPQYAEGISAVFASLGVNPSTGTVPSRGCLPPEGVSAVAEQGVGYVVVTPSCTRSGNTTATPGHYLVKGQQVTALVADDVASAALRGGDEQRLMRRVFESHLDGAEAPVVVLCDIGDGQSSAQALIGSADSMASQPWIRASLGKGLAAARPRRTIALRGRSASNAAPAGYWDEVGLGRVWATALGAALGEGTPEAVAARRNSLIAQSSAWAGVNDDWALADRGRDFASAAVRASREVLDPVTLRVEPVTLAGKKGAVPITISNGSDRSLVIELSIRPSGGVRIVGETLRRVELPPQETFVEMPVEMPDSLSGELAVTISSGGLELVTQAVPIRTSYLDRLVMIGGVLLVLAALLVIIVRKARPGAETLSSDTSAGRPHEADDADRS